MLAPGDAASLVEELRKDALRCVHDQHGNHVIQKCIEVTARAREESTDKDVKLAVLRRTTTRSSLLAQGRWRRIPSVVGLQRVLDTGAGLSATRQLEATRPSLDWSTSWSTRDEMSHSLLEHQYANYVMQHCIQFGRPQDRSATIREVKNHLVDFSRHKFASNVVEKCLEFGDDSDRKDLVARRW